MEIVCPVCRKRGKPVKISTVNIMVIKPCPPKVNYFFCATPDCEVVYFHSHQIRFHKNEVKIKIHQKETCLNVPLCYCFGWTKKSITEDFQQHGKSTVIEEISAHMKGKNCNCELNNPSGA